MLIQKEGISARQLVLLYVLAALSQSMRQFPRQLTLTAGKAGWLAPLAALPGLLLLLFVYGRMLKHARGGLAEICTEALGRPIGKFVLILYFFWFLIMLSSATRFSAELFPSTAYIEGSVLFFVLVLLSFAFFLARGKLVVLARFSELIFFLILTALTVVIVFSLKDLKPYNILPVWTGDALPVLRASIPVFSVSGGMYTYLMFLSFRTEDKSRLARISSRATVLFCALCSAMALAVTGMFGAGLSSRMQSPFFLMVKSTTIFTTFDRVEMVVVAVWVLTDLLYIAALTAGAAHIFKSVSGARDSAPFALPVAMLTFSGCFLIAHSTFELTSFIYGVMQYGHLVFGLIIPILVFVIGLIRRKI